MLGDDFYITVFLAALLWGVCLLYELYGIKKELVKMNSKRVIFK